MREEEGLFWPLAIAAACGVTVGLTGSIGAMVLVLLFGVALWYQEARDHE